MLPELVVGFFAAIGAAVTGTLIACAIAVRLGLRERITIHLEFH